MQMMTADVPRLRAYLETPERPVPTAVASAADRARRMNEAGDVELSVYMKALLCILEEDRARESKTRAEGRSEIQQKGPALHGPSRPRRNRRCKKFQTSS